MSFQNSQEVEFIKQKYEPTPNEQSKDWKKLRLSGGTETVLQNRFSYQVPEMVGTNYSTEEKHNIHN